MLLKDKVIIVTGVGPGMGRKLASIGAAEGAKIAALSLRERAEAESILREVEYVELSGRADFNDLFIDQLAFPG